MTLYCTKKRRSQLGAVYAEALIMLPVLLILWVGVLFMHSQYYQNQQARLVARQCAWEYSEKGCEGPKPSICPEDPETQNGYEDLPDPLQYMDNKSDQLEKRDRESQFETYKNPISDALEVDKGLFGSPVKVVASKHVERPSLFGGGKKATQAKQYLMCNEAEKNFLEKAINIGTSILSH
ncbi:MAG: pilus assembly protein [Myxococcales bacterium]|nr:MAG: pilus assembly protein [Myxococcales bacterium]